MVECLFKNCHYQTNVSPSFNAHKSRSHPNVSIADLKVEVIDRDTDSQSVQGDMEPDEGNPFQNTPEVGTPTCNPLVSGDDTGVLQNQLRNNFASLLLKMQSILHVSEMAIQDIVENVTDIFIV